MNKLQVVFRAQRAEELTEELAENLKKVIYQYSGRMTLATAIGVMQIVAHEIVNEAE
jgi:hypothetical protein